MTNTTLYSVPSLLTLSANVVAAEIEKNPDTYKDVLKNTVQLHTLLPYIFLNSNLTDHTITKFIEKGYFLEVLTEELLKQKRLLKSNEIATLKQMLNTSKTAIKVSEACKTYDCS